MCVPQLWQSIKCETFHSELQNASVMVVLESEGYILILNCEDLYESLCKSIQLLSRHFTNSQKREPHCGTRGKIRSSQ